MSTQKVIPCIFATDPEHWRTFATQSNALSKYQNVRIQKLKILYPKNEIHFNSKGYLVSFKEWAQDLLLLLVSIFQGMLEILHKFRILGHFKDLFYCTRVSKY